MRRGYVECLLAQYKWSISGSFHYWENTLNTVRRLTRNKTSIWTEAVTRKEEIPSKTKPNPEKWTGFQTLTTVKTGQWSLRDGKQVRGALRRSSLLTRECAGSCAGQEFQAKLSHLPMLTRWNWGSEEAKAARAPWQKTKGRGQGICQGAPGVFSWLMINQYLDVRKLSERKERTTRKDQRKQSPDLTFGRKSLCSHKGGWKTS